MRNESVHRELGCVYACGEYTMYNVHVHVRVYMKAGFDL